MKLDNLTGKHETQTCAALLLRATLADLRETPEEKVNLVRRNPITRVPHFELDCLGAPRQRRSGRPDRHNASFRGELESVGKEIGEHLQQSIAITGERRSSAV